MAEVCGAADGKTPTPKAILAQADRPVAIVDGTGEIVDGLMMTQARR